MKAKPVRNVEGQMVLCAVLDATHVVLNIAGPIGKIVLPIMLTGEREGTGNWSWNGDMEKPTLRPSIASSNGGVYCHTWVNDGKAQYLSDTDHSFRNHTLDLIDVDPEELCLETGRHRSVGWASSERTMLGLSYVLLIDGSVTHHRVCDIAALVYKLEQPLIIVAESYTEDALIALVHLAVRDNRLLAILKTPGEGIMRDYEMRRIEAFAHAIPVLSSASLTTHQLGQVKDVRLSANKTEMKKAW